MKIRFYSGALAAIMGVGTLLAGAVPAHARGGEDTWKYLTYGLGAATVYGAVKRNPTIALIGAAGTAYSYSRWKKAVRDRHRREYYYRSRVRGYRSYYRPAYRRSYRRVTRHYYRRPVKVYRTVTYYR